MPHIHTVSLVLGSGGARGHAHIGVIRAIEERGYDIRNIAGCSMGALIGGVYAAGALDDYADWAFRLERTDVLRLLDMSFSGGSLFKGERVFDALRDLLGERQIEELDRGFVAVATALEEQREVWLNRGELFAAIRASSAVPGVFAPVTRDHRLLVDGGLINPIPIAPTLMDTTDATIAVNLNAIQGRRQPPLAANDRDACEQEREEEGYGERLVDWLRGSFGSSDGTTKQKSPSAIDILSKSLDTMQGDIARMKLATYAPTTIVEIPRHAADFFEFDRAEELAQLGYEAAHSVLDRLQD